jgi:hypothetical protein
MPPAPSALMISYGPRRVPAVSGMGPDQISLVFLQELRSSGEGLSRTSKQNNSLAPDLLLHDSVRFFVVFVTGAVVTRHV